MGNGDNRYGDDRFGNNDRWQTPDRNDQWGRQGGGRSERERGSYGDWGSERDRGTNWGGDRNRGGDNDRGFIERATDEVRSWFSDDDDRGRGQSQGRSSNWDRSSNSFGGGFGNQRGWGDDHFERGQQGGMFGGGSDDRSSGGRSGFFGGGRDRSEDQGGYAGGSSRSSWGGGGGGADTWGGSGFGGPDDNGRRFDRIDPGHVGAQGAHPMSSPVGGAYGGGDYSRSAAIMSQSGGGQHHGIDPQARDRMLGRGGGQSYGQSSGQSYGQSGGQGYGSGQSFGGGGQSFRSGQGGGFGGHQDPHYSEWRQRQIQQLDQDYDEYRREHQSKFEQEFGGWRQKRQGQRQSLGRVSEHMEVVGSDGQHIGTVDKVRGDRIILTKSDPEAGGIHHSIPCSWIEQVEDKVTINKSADEAKQAWRTEEENQALFEGNRGASSQSGEGPHMLDRSFSGTYDDNKK